MDQNDNYLNVYLVQYVKEASVEIILMHQLTYYINYIKRLVMHGVGFRGGFRGVRIPY